MMKQIAIMGGIAAMLAVFANADNATAAMTRQQAWSRCLKTVNAIEPRTASNDAHRTAQMKACLARMGHPHG
jgi:hypothetical protein